VDDEARTLKPKGEWRGQNVESLRERFSLYVHPEPNTGCWLWSGGCCKGGYGVFSVKKDHRWVQVKASHVALALDGRPLEEGLLACHSCDFPPCVNPDHLFGGTYKDNNQDSARKGRRSGRLGTGRPPPMKTGNRIYRAVCPQGHSITGDNVYVTPGGYEACRACRANQKAAFDQRRRLMKVCK
jgi:hypothetical protein